MKTTLIWVSIELVTDGGVRAPESTLDNVIPVARDGYGDPYTPGTSLAGSLRAHLGSDAPALMGQPPGSEELTSSALRILGTTTTPAGELPVRGQTAIDRRRGAAGVNTLRQSQTLPAGSTIDMYLRLDDPDVHWSTLAGRLASWRPQVGGGRTGGRGQARITAIRHGCLDLTTPDGLTTWLTLGGPALVGHVATSNLRARPAPPEQSVFQWHVTDALHVGVGDRGAGTAPALRDGKDRPIIPGTTWKGVIRGRCEWILTTLGHHLCQERSCGRCGSCLLFGWSGRAGTRDGRGPTGGRGRVEFSDSLLRALPGKGPAAPTTRTHVAIDRVTGGARDTLLYSRETFPAAQVTLTLTADAPLEPWMWALLLLALRDVHDGYVGIGAATTRGYGTLEATDPGALDPTPQQFAALQAFVASTGAPV